MGATTPTFTFVLPPELKAGLQLVRERDGVAEAEQIRRGIAMWLEAKGVKLPPKRPRKHR
jgi:hypothetical protein